MRKVVEEGISRWDEGKSIIEGGMGMGRGGSYNMLKERCQPPTPNHPPPTPIPPSPRHRSAVNSNAKFAKTVCSQFV